MVGIALVYAWYILDIWQVHIWYGLNSVIKKADG